ncbi:hypothetical protein U9K52_02175 [Chryseobacterium sp. MHB01]|uniref:bacteriocin-like protein n=1 Tax=Chryseobacterium sp. MHB01 TaxID=3109433 RepID=UPI002AFFA293|nr:hypothetical protein [Chryseobacterium sp. MHB01]MEA1847706.1 hypothetical protein [Chryseobacterium sp. MHB01]
MKKFKKLTREDLKTVRAGQVWIAVTKCGFTATTTQDWTAEQANAWVDEIEKITVRLLLIPGLMLNI